MPKPPSWNEIRANAHAFVARWVGETRENAEAQTFWNEFMAVFGVDRRRVATFEARARRVTTGGRGRIDLLWPSVLVAEHKSAGMDLSEAEAQALDYLESIDADSFPGVVLTSDFAHFRLLDLSANDVAVEFPLMDLVKEIDRFGFIAGYTSRDFSAHEETAANIGAARLMGDLHERLSAGGYEGHDASVLLTRLLFLLFGDDTGMWEKALFAEFVETRTQADGSDTGAQLAHLFQVLDQPVNRRPDALDELLARFPYVNGGLFRDRIDIPSFTREMRAALIECCHFNWAAISPAIFGSMFQAVKSRTARRGLGEHYTTEANIMKVVGPLFLDQFRADFKAAHHNVNQLKRLRSRVGEYRYLDPACGCGNFLVIAYRELRRLELDILLRLRDLTGDGQLSLDPTLGLEVRLDHFYGIELEEWPARIAETAMFLIDHQANLDLAREFGTAPERLPIDIAATIHIGNAVRTDWSSVLPATDQTIVLGNPPFVGMAWMNKEQQQDNRAVFDGLDVAMGLRTGRLDYVACWYAKAITYLAGTTGRAAFVSTNSISQGEQARTMHPLLRRAGFKVDFAHRTFRWTSEAPNAAVVHVVIVGFSLGGQAKVKRLFEYPTLSGQPVEATATNINFYLIDGTDDVPDKRREPLISGLPKATQGNKPWDGGGLIIEPQEYMTFANDPVASKYLRAYRQSDEMLYSRDRWCLWLANASPSELHVNKLLQGRMDIVAKARGASPTPAVQLLARTPSLFAQIRQPATRYLALPEVSSENREYIPGRYFEPDVIAGNKLIVFPGAPLWIFAYLQSAAFNAWVRTFAGRLKSDPSISPSTCYFTFPFIEPDRPSRARIEQAAQSILDARDRYPSETLATLYDPRAMPADLRAAHVEVDRLIDRLHSMRLPTEGQRVKALLQRYDELAHQSELIPTSTASRRRRQVGPS